MQEAVEICKAAYSCSRVNSVRLKPKSLITQNILLTLKQKFLLLKVSVELLENFINQAQLEAGF